MTRPDKLAYLLDADQLAGIFADWPEEMSVALCLDDTGTCELMVYHQDEGRAVLRKVASVLRRPLGSFIVVPEHKGYPTRKVMFSEEQKLLSLVADAWDLPETATDYAINYRYAQDQGLDPETMKPPQARPSAQVITPTFRHRGAPRPAPKAAPTPKMVDITPVAPEAPAAEKRPRVSVRPRLRLSMGGLARKLTTPEPAPVAAVAEARDPAGYYPAAAFDAAECHVLDGQIFEHGDCIRVVIARDRMTVNTKPVRVAEVLFRDDFVRFLMPRDVLQGWEAGEAAVLDIPIEKFPAPLADRYREFARYADVSVTEKGVFVGPIDRIPNWKPLEARPRPLLRRVLTPARAAGVAVLALGLTAGALIGTMDPDGDRIAAFLGQVAGGESAPVVTRSIGTPLDLIGTLAREEALGEVSSGQTK